MQTSVLYASFTLLLLGATCTRGVEDTSSKGKLGPVSVRIGVAESDQEAVASWNNLSKGQKLTAQLSLDASQKLVVKVSTAIKLHQVFVMLRRKNDKREIAFVAQPETAGKTDYKLEVDMTANAKDLSYKSGVYEVILFLGDFSIDDSTEWQVGEVKVQLPAGKPKDVNPLYAVNYGPKPEIKHMFRQPEPRPPRLLSDLFTLIVLAPFVVLFALWFKVGANIKAFPASLSAIAFHLGLAGMFGVYFLFWLKLTMFEALKILTIPGLITFVGGHRLLVYISERRTSSGSSS